MFKDGRIPKCPVGGAYFIEISSDGTILVECPNCNKEKHNPQNSIKVSTPLKSETGAESLADDVVIETVTNEEGTVVEIQTSIVNSSLSSTTTQNNTGDSQANNGGLNSNSSNEEKLNYFNNALNNVKPNAKKIVLTKEVNSKAGSVSGLPAALNSMADSLISSNMGEKDVSSVSPATTVNAKSAMFPVENETWASKLTMEDVESIDFKNNGSTYEITVFVKADAPSTDTGHGNGHNGKIFSVISPAIVIDNAGPAASVISEVKTGHKDGKVTITVDKATGNVTSATYYFVWTLEVKAMGANISMPFGLEKQFKIYW